MTQCNGWSDFAPKMSDAHGGADRVSDPEGAWPGPRATHPPEAAAAAPARRRPQLQRGQRRHPPPRTRDHDRSDECRTAPALPVYIRPGPKWSRAAPIKNRGGRTTVAGFCKKESKTFLGRQLNMAPTPLKPSAPLRAFLKYQRNEAWLPAVAIGGQLSKNGSGSNPVDPAPSPIDAGFVFPPRTTINNFFGGHISMT